MKSKKLTLTNVDVHYNENTAEIILTSTDPILKKKPFQLKLSSHTTTYNTLLTALNEKGLVNLENTKVPSFIASNPQLQQTYFPQEPKTKIYIGETFNNEKVTLDLKISPHTLISGETGSGKSVLQRTIIAHALQNPEYIELYGIDLKKVELYPYFQKTPENFAPNLYKATQLVEKLTKILTERYTQMEQQGYNNYTSFPNSKAIYIIIDELHPIISKENVQTLEGQTRDAQHVKIEKQLETIARLGRAANMYLFIGTQRPDATCMKNEFKANLGTRIIMGPSNATTTHLTLNSKPKYGGALLQNKGRGIVETYGKQKLTQIYYMPPETIEPNNNH